MSAWISVLNSEHEDPVEVQTESDGSLLLSTVTSQFPGVVGLRFRNPKTNGLRGVRCHDNVLYPPEENGWGANTYICVHSPSERKSNVASDETTEEDVGSKMIAKETTDLIIIPLSFAVTEEYIKNCFAMYGSLSKVVIKRHPNGLPKGYGFIRFHDVEAQTKATMTRHFIYDRWCEVKFPDNPPRQLRTKEGVGTAGKVFVASTSENLTEGDLREWLDVFGTVTDVSFPPVAPFRSFAFVTFEEAEVAQALHGKELTFKNTSIDVCLANTDI